MISTVSIKPGPAAGEMMKLRYPVLIGMGALALRHHFDILLILAIPMVMCAGLVLAHRMVSSPVTMASNPRLPSFRQRFAVLVGLAIACIGLSFRDEALAFATVVWAGLLLGMRMAPSLATIVSNPRLPASEEWLAVLAGLMTAYLGFGFCDQVLGIDWALADSHASPAHHAELIASLLVPLWLAVALLPAGAQLLRQGRGAAASAREALAGMAASLPLGLALFLTWQMAGERLTLYGLDDQIVAAVLWLIPTAGFLSGLGGLYWWKALGGRDTEPEFGLLMRLARLLWAIQAGLLLIGIALMLLGAWKGAVSSAVLLGGACLLMVAAAWMRTLGGLVHSTSDGAVRTMIAAILLLICFAASQLAPVWVMAFGHTSLGDMGIFAALAALPVIWGTVFICRKWVPWAIGRIVGSA